MSNYNLNAGYGSKMGNVLTGVTSGKTFLVVSSTAGDISRLQDLLPADTDGVGRVFTSITAALAACTANQGDVVLVAPGYTETVIAAAGLTVTVAGVTIRGLGKGSLRPTVTFTTAVAASFDITAANTTIENMVFVCGIDAQTAMCNVTGADVTFDNVEFRTNSGTVGTILGILTAATATRLKVVNSRFVGPATNSGTTTTAQIKHEVGVDYVIQGNYCTGKMTQSILNATAVLGGLIDNNRFVVATGTKAIAMEATSTPFISNNRINVPSGTAPIIAAAGFVAGNIYSAAA